MFTRSMLLVFLLGIWGCTDDLTDYKASEDDILNQKDSDTNNPKDTNKNDTASNDLSDTDSTNNPDDSDSQTTNDTSTENNQTNSYIMIEAECALGEFAGDCDASNTGDVGGPLDYELPRIDDAQPGVVGYMAKDNWIRLDDIDMTGFNTITLNLASNEADAVLRVSVDSPTGPVLAVINVGSTGGWDVFKEFTSVFKVGFTGVKDLYITGVTEYIGNGNIDWIALENDKSVKIETDPEYTHIEAECAIGDFQGDCNGSYTGSTSKSEAIWGGADSYPNVSEESPNAVGYFLGDGATWIKIDQVDLTDMTKIILHAGSAEDNCGLIINLDSPDGTRLAAAAVPNGGDWASYSDIEKEFDAPVTGKHDIYILGGKEDSGNARLDWIEFK